MSHNIKKMLSKIERVIHAITRGLLWVAAAGMFIIILVMVVNVIGRFFFRQPLQGSIEAVEILMVLIAYSVLAYTEQKRGHINIEIIISRFSRRGQAILTSVMCFIGAAFFLIWFWQSADLMWSNIFPEVAVTDNFNFPVAIYIAVMAFGFLMLGLETLINAYRTVPPKESEIKEPE